MRLSLAKLRIPVLIAAVGLTGCAAGQPRVISETIGPAQAPAVNRTDRGSLLVYSDWDKYDTLDADHQKHTAYRISPEQGGQTILVRNRKGSFGESPEAVELAPGKYVIEAQANQLGTVRVPVRVRTGETTVVYLDGVTAPPAVERTQTEKWVRHPSGGILGWRDSESTGHVAVQTK